MSGSDPNETIHFVRRPSLPELGPDPEPPPSGRRTVTIVVAAVLASLFAGYVTTTMLAEPRDTATTATSTAARTETAPPVTRRPGGTLAPTTPETAPGPGLTQPPPTATTASPAAPVPPPAPVADAGFDAPIPSGWREREFAVQKPGFKQSRWSDPRDPRTDVIIDWSDGNRSRPAEAAAALRAAVAGRTDYREVRFSPTRDKGWIWVYTLLDDRGRRIARIDLISRHCGVLFAVLGTTPTKRFKRLQGTFIAVSEGIRLKRRRC